jgi:hypothetical protein
MTDAKTRLGRDVYVALAAVGWADGKLDQDEADAIVRAASQFFRRELPSLSETVLSQIDELSRPRKRRLKVVLSD